MRKTFPFLLSALTLPLLLTSCNEPLEVRANEAIVAPDSNRVADFNVLIMPGPHPVTKVGDTLSVPLEVYLRPYEWVGGVEYTLLFESDIYGYLDIDGKRLLPGDRIRVAYDRFKNYRMPASFGSRIVGKKQITLTFASGGTSRKARTEIDLTF